MPKTKLVSLIVTSLSLEWKECVLNLILFQQRLEYYNKLISNKLELPALVAAAASHFLVPAAVLFVVPYPLVVQSWFMYSV